MPQKTYETTPTDRGRYSYQRLKPDEYTSRIQMLRDKLQAAQDAEPPEETWGHWAAHTAVPAAIRTIPALAGGIAGSMIAPGAGTVGGGALGAGGGEIGAQAYEKWMGDRKEYSPGEMALSTGIGAIPFAEGAAGLGTVGRAALHGAQGAVIGGGQTIGSSLIHKGELPELSDVGRSALLGGTIGAVAGGISGRRAAGSVVEAPPKIVEGRVVPRPGPRLSAHETLGLPQGEQSVLPPTTAAPFPPVRPSRVSPRQGPFAAGPSDIPVEPTPRMTPVGPVGLPSGTSPYANMADKELMGLVSFGDKAAWQELQDRGSVRTAGPSPLGDTPLQSPRPMGARQDIAPIAPPEPQGLAPVEPIAPPKLVGRGRTAAVAPPPEPARPGVGILQKAAALGEPRPVAPVQPALPLPQSTGPAAPIPGQPTYEELGQQITDIRKTLRSREVSYEDGNALHTKMRELDRLQEKLYPERIKAEVGKLTGTPVPEPVAPIVPEAPPATVPEGLGARARRRAAAQAEPLPPRGSKPALPKTPLVPKPGRVSIRTEDDAAWAANQKEMGFSPKEITAARREAIKQGIDYTKVSDINAVEQTVGGKPAPLEAVSPVAQPGQPSFDELNNRIGQLMKQSMGDVPDEQWGPLTTELSSLKAQRNKLYPDELDAMEMRAGANQKAATGRALSGERPPFAQRLRDERGMVDLTGQKGIPPQEPIGGVAPVEERTQGLGSRIAEAYKKSRFGSESGAVSLEGGMPDISAAVEKGKKKFQGAGEWVGKRLGESRTYKAGLDVSAMLRQGGHFKGRGFFWKNLPDAYDSLMSQEGADRVSNWVKDHPLYEKAKEHGVFFSDDKKLEESIVSKAAELGPFPKGSKASELYQGSVGRAYKATNRFHGNFLNGLRMRAFEDMTKNAKPDEIGAISKYINSATGRGSLNFKNPLTGVQHNLEPAANFLNKTFFSARFAKSRLDLLNPNLYAGKSSKGVRLQALRDLGTNVGLVMAAGALAKRAGAEVALDPRNPDFGKVKVGNSRIDFTNGMQPYIRIISQLVTDAKISSQTGKLSVLNTGKFGSPTKLETLERFTEGKFAPLPAFAANYLRGKKVTGEDTSYTSLDPFKNEFTSMFTPMLADDIKNLAQSDPKALWMAPFAAAGDSVQTYGQTQKTTGGGSSRRSSRSTSRSRR